MDIPTPAPAAMVEVDLAPLGITVIRDHNPDSTAGWRLFAGTQTFGGIILRPRFGFSPAMAQLMAAAHATGAVASWYASPTDAAPPSATTIVDYTVTDEDASVSLLEQASEILTARRSQRAWYEPSTAAPALLVFLDDADRLLASPQHGVRAGELCLRLAKAGRRHGVGIILAVESPSLYGLGGNEVLRSILVDHNVAIDQEAAARDRWHQATQFLGLDLITRSTKAR